MGAPEPDFQLSFWTTKVLVSSPMMLETQLSEYALKTGSGFPFNRSARFLARIGHAGLGLYVAAKIPFVAIPRLVTDP